MHRGASPVELQWACATHYQLHDATTEPRALKIRRVLTAADPL